MLKDMNDSHIDTMFRVADMMVTAARTAPKASGQDKVVACVVSGEEKQKIADKMLELGREFNEDFIIRDSANFGNARVAVLIGVRKEPLGIDNCSMCGYGNCAEMAKDDGNCALNITDLGIAIGSAVAIAADHRIDNRVMYSVGRAVREMEGIFPEGVRVCYGIPLSVSSKSPFFDRGPGDVMR